MSGERASILDRTSIVVIEGDAFIGSKARCAKLCRYLEQIIGDRYSVEQAPRVSCLGVQEPHPSYS